MDNGLLLIEFVQFVPAEPSNPSHIKTGLQRQYLVGDGRWSHCSDNLLTHYVNYERLTGSEIIASEFV